MKILPTEKVALISAIDADMRGYKITFTIFGYKSWVAWHPGFDVNAIALSTAKTVLNREAKLVNGKDVGIALENVEPSYGPASDSSLLGIRDKLIILGQEWQVDRIILLQSEVTSDWLNGRAINLLEGFGLCSQSEKGDASIYGNFLMRFFDCRTGQFFKFDSSADQARPLPGVHWHDSWDAYTSEEKQTTARALGTLIKQSLPILLAKTGLTDIVSDRPTVDWKP
ncbi:MAG TPA: hypothetical protein VNW23_05760 [Opitutaceae bacterium]|nr:hypothetical protein [Opitutaceae bacterium]